MELTANERAQAVVRYLAKKTGYAQMEIGKQLGYTNKSSLSQVLNGTKPLPAKFTEKLCALYPEINQDFIRGTSDKLLLSELNDQEPAVKPGIKPSGVYIPLELVQMFTELSATVRSQQETIRLLIGEKAQAAI